MLESLLACLKGGDHHPSGGGSAMSQHVYARVNHTGFLKAVGMATSILLISLYFILFHELSGAQWLKLLRMYISQITYFTFV